MKLESRMAVARRLLAWFVIAFALTTGVLMRATPALASPPNGTYSCYYDYRTGGSFFMGNLILQSPSSYRYTENGSGSGSDTSSGTRLTFTSGPLRGEHTIDNGLQHWSGGTYTRLTLYNNKGYASTCDSSTKKGGNGGSGSGNGQGACSTMPCGSAAGVTVYASDLDRNAPQSGNPATIGNPPPKLVYVHVRLVNHNKSGYKLDEAEFGLEYADGGSGFGQSVTVTLSNGRRAECTSWPAQTIPRGGSFSANMCFNGSDSQRAGKLVLRFEPPVFGSVANISLG